MLNGPDFDRLCVVLVSTRNPLNIGAAARAMCNFGFRKLRVVNPYEQSFREARSAVGALTLLTGAEEFENVADAVADCILVVGTVAVGHRHAQHPLRTLQDGAPRIVEILRVKRDAPQRVALLFGSEKSGLTNEDLSHCHWRMHIPTNEEQPSMNLGQAVAVCLYEISRGAIAMQSVEKPSPATAGETERVTTVLLDALEASDYLSICPAADKQETVRRMVRRLNLSADDASVFLGMLRQIAWKLRTKS